MPTLHAAWDFFQRHPRIKAPLRAMLRPVLPLLGPYVDPRHHQSSYQAWIRVHDRLSETDRAAIRAHIAELPWHPLISVAMPAYETDPALLRAAIASVRAQLWPHWELCVADDASPSPDVAAVLEEAAGEDARIRWTRRRRNGHIAAATNSAIALATGEFIALMDHDDLLAEHALYEVAAMLNRHPETDLVYSDEDSVDAEGQRSEPYFKPDFDPDLLLGQNFVNHLAVYRASLLRGIGGLREGVEGSQDHDLALRTLAASDPARIRHIPAILYHWRRRAKQASFSEEQLGRCLSASRSAVVQHLAATGQWGTKVTASPVAPMWNRVIRPVPDPAPLVSVIVPTRDHSALLRSCARGLLQVTDYPALELLIVDNGSEEEATAALFAELARDSRVRILRAPGPFNYSRLNNQATREARGELLLLMNNDVEAVDPLWLREMVSHAVRPDVGAVGARLLYADGRLQHAGVVLGIGGVAVHIHSRASRGDPGHFGSLALTRQVSAVTGACLMLRREVFTAIGGLDESNLPIAFNDVDLCLRIRERGLRVLWTPFAELLHLESVSRGSDMRPERRDGFAREVAYMKRRWGKTLTSDPFYNPNLSLSLGDYHPAIPPRRTPPWREPKAAVVVDERVALKA